MPRARGSARRPESSGSRSCRTRPPTSGRSSRAGATGRSTRSDRTSTRSPTAARSTARSGSSPGFVAVEAARRAGGRARPLAVGAMVDEEGPRFGAAIFGSRALCGELGGRRRAGAHRSGRTRPARPRGAARRDGRDPARRAGLPAARRLVDRGARRAGPPLVDVPAPLGVATSLAARERWRCTLRGVSDHAGTAAMAGRRDALVPAARAVLAAHELALAEPGAVATVGRISALPGSTNQVPGEARLSLDVRAPDQAALERVRDGVQAAAAADGIEAAVGARDAPIRAATSTPVCARRCTRRRAPRARSPSTSRPTRATTRACSHAICRRRCCSCATRPASRTTRPRAPPRRTASPPARCSRACSCAPVTRSPARHAARRSARAAPRAARPPAGGAG